jgi:alpha-1,3-mannosyltransferase
MRLVHVVRQFHPAVGGLEGVVWELATRQSTCGHAVRVVTLDRIFNAPHAESLAPRETAAGIEIVRIPYVGSTRYPVAPSVLRHIRDADVVHVHGIDFFFDYLAWTAPLHRRKLVVSTHGGFFHTGQSARLKRLYFATVTRLSLSRYAGVAAVSIGDDRLFTRIRSRGTTLIENGVNVERYADASAKAPMKTMIAVGRLSGNKRLDRVIAFAAALHRRDPQWRLKIVGRPWDLSVADLVRLAEQAGIGDAVEVHASLSDAEVRILIGSCSVFVSASAYEGFGLAAVEALSAGLYPVLSGILPFRHLVARSNVGMVVDFAEPDAAAEDFLDRWADVVADHGRWRKAAMNAALDYDWERVSTKYEALYESALGTRVRSILDVMVRVSTFGEAVDALDRRFAQGVSAIVVFANAHTLNTTASDREARSALQRSIVFNDGIGVDIASRILYGKWFPENMNGTDFIPNYLRQTRNRYRIYLLGGQAGIAERAAAHIMNITPHHEIVGWCHGYGTTEDPTATTERIRRSGADVLLVAMGNPKQELWLLEHLAETGCRLGFGVGALFDFMAGAVPRAPPWMRAARIEWAYRLMHEPGRLWRRYLVGMPSFLIKVAAQWCVGARISGGALE